MHHNLSLALLCVLALSAVTYAHLEHSVVIILFPWSHWTPLCPLTPLTISFNCTASFLWFALYCFEFPCLQCHLVSFDDIFWNQFSVSGICIYSSEQPALIPYTVTLMALGDIYGSLQIPQWLLLHLMIVFLVLMFGCLLISLSIMLIK